jgi:hypothetical protein
MERLKSYGCSINHVKSNQNGECMLDDGNEDFKKNHFPIYEKIISCINELFANDQYLLLNNANERTIAHRFAVYLEKEFEHSEYKVDCEYNKLGQKIKNVDREEPLFRWSEVPGVDADNLKKYIQRKGTILERHAEFEKTESTICIQSAEGSISLRLNENKTKVNLKINNKYYNLSAQEEDNVLNIYENQNVIPDIIVHKRGDSDNLLVIEVEKTNQHDHAEKDLWKLERLIEDPKYDYQFALFIKFNTCQKFEDSKGNPFERCINKIILKKKEKKNEKVIYQYISMIS